jgi:hypothetical protein
MPPLSRLIKAHCVTATLFVLGSLALGCAGSAKPAHIFVIVLENEDFDSTFGPQSPASYLKGLAGRGALLTNYYGIGHYSLDNYIAMISGQAPNPATQSDCQVFTEFVQTGMAADGQAVGAGCVYPAGVPTIAAQLEARGLTWRAYMEDMGNIPDREAASCGHPAIGLKDETQRAVAGDQYATRHNPFMYFHGVIDGPGCARRVVNLAALRDDLRSIGSTPDYAFIVPNLCHDGHDGDGRGKTCVDGEPGGLVSADRFLAETVPAILASAAFQKDGLLIVTFDESDIDVKIDPATRQPVLAGGDVTSCCDEQPGPNIPAGALVFGKTPDQGPGVLGPGGGRIGAVLVSRSIKPGTVSDRAYNHYALLRSIEDMFGLDHLGYAGRRGLEPFGPDVFTNPGG